MPTTETRCGGSISPNGLHQLQLHGRMKGTIISLVLHHSSKTLPLRKFKHFTMTASRQFCCPRQSTVLFVVAKSSKLLPNKSQQPTGCWQVSPLHSICINLTVTLQLSRTLDCLLTT